MKKFMLGILVMGTLLVSCASKPQERTVSSLPRDKAPGPNESEVVVQYTSSILHKAKGLLNIFVDGEMVAQVMADTTERIIVRNGPHTISVRQPGKKDISMSGQFEANSERITFTVLRIFMTLSLTNQSQTPLTGETSGIRGAITGVGNKFIESLPENASVAILSVATRDQNEASLIINELEYMLVGSKRFKIVDRKSLDTIRSEQNFQMSGEVSDDSAISIGQMLGASVVITGSVTESGSAKSLSLKALDVQTSEIVAMEREFY
jgi:curli biogenesis system outer membrane secretion channel CsgG